MSKKTNTEDKNTTLSDQKNKSINDNRKKRSLTESITFILSVRVFKD